MKNRKLLSALCLCMLSCVHANSQEMHLSGDGGRCTKGHRFEISVSYDDTSVTLKSENTLDNVYVVIKDFDGNTIYNGWTTIDKTSNTIMLPEEEGIDKYTIEVYVDEECMKGYFE